MPSLSLASKPVVVVGGGLSGLAAAVELASRQIPVILLEQKAKLGGRAYSFADEATGDVVDNGQHVLIAGYGRTLAFLERIGTKELLTVQRHPTLHLHHPLRGFCTLRLPRLPSPMHFLAGILASDLLSFSDKCALLRAAMFLVSGRGMSDADRMTVDGMLTALRQSDETKRSFWEPLAISIMNEHITKASAEVFFASLQHAFLGGWKNAALAIPRVGLSELYVNDAAGFIKRNGGEARVNADAAEIVAVDDKVVSVRLKDGSTIGCSAVVLAVPHYRVEGLLPSYLRGQFSAIVNIPSTPIVSVHMWFEDDFMPQDAVGLIGRRVQWVFNKRRINREMGKGGHVSCVISAADGFVEMSNDELTAIALADLRSAFAYVQEPVHSLVIREKRATFSCTPESERLRPHHKTSLPNLFLAGDWTKTGLPATIEGAIRSGEECAKMAAQVLS